MVPITFTDDDGVVWDVWEVTRTLEHTTRAAYESEPRTLLDDVPVRGSLCFLSARGKRRLDHYPRFWSLLSLHALERLCAMAEAVPHSEILPGPDARGGGAPRRDEVGHSPEAEPS